MTEQLVNELLANRTLTQLREVQALLRLTDQYEPDRLNAACQRALEVGDGRYRTVRGMLERGMDLLAPEVVPPPQRVGAFLRGPEELVGGQREVS